MVENLIQRPHDLNAGSAGVISGLDDPKIAQFGTERNLLFESGVLSEGFWSR